MNMYNLDLITKDVVIYKANQFIGGNGDLLAWLKVLLQYNGEEAPVENKPEPPTGRVSLQQLSWFWSKLSLAPQAGKSNRLAVNLLIISSLHRANTFPPGAPRSPAVGAMSSATRSLMTSGRRIQPGPPRILASSLTGRTATRKACTGSKRSGTIDDFYIEANQKCIQLLEPIAQQMLTLNPGERANFKMPPGLGGQSTSIYRRVLKKMYGPEKGRGGRERDVQEPVLGRPHRHGTLEAEG